MRLSQLVVQREEPRLIRRESSRVWGEASDTVSAKILGPHLEDLAREWMLSHASEETLGGRASWVRPATMACKQHQEPHELDVVAVQSSPHQGDRVLAIGEVKAMSKPFDVPALERLEHLRELMPDHLLSGSVKLILFGRGGFTPPLRQEADSRPDVELVDMNRLYQGD